MRNRVVTSVPMEVPPARLDRLSEFCFDVASAKGDHDEKRNFEKAITQLTVQLATINPQPKGLMVNLDQAPRGLDAEMAAFLFNLFEACDQFGIQLDDAFKYYALWRMERPRWL